MFLNLPRHESNTLLTAVLTAKDLFAQSVSSKVCINNLKDSPLAVYYYVFILNHTILYHILAKSQGVIELFFIFF